MDFASFTIGLLLLRGDAPGLSEADADRLQDEHMSHLADLHAAGDLLAAGPVLGTPDRELRGFAVYASADVEQVRLLAEGDPAVRAGRYRTELHPWMLPAGLVAFTPGQLPRSMAEARGPAAP